MFQVRDYSVFTPSPNAARSFRAQQRLTWVIQGIFIILGVLSVWNIGRLIQLRLIKNQDLASISDIIQDPSTRLIWMFAIVALILIGVREFVFTEPSIGVIYPLTAVLAVLLVPAMMSEIQPALKDQTLRFVVHECPAKAIVNNELSSIAKCGPHAIHDGDVMLATSNPADGSFETIDVASGGQNTVGFNFTGRGTYTVYLMMKQDDMASCERGMLFQRTAEAEMGVLDCVQTRGDTWLVLPQTTSYNSPSGIHLINVTIP